MSVLNELLSLLQNISSAPLLREVAFCATPLCPAEENNFYISASKGWLGACVSLLKERVCFYVVIFYVLRAAGLSLSGGARLEPLDASLFTQLSCFRFCLVCSQSHRPSR